MRAKHIIAAGLALLPAAAFAGETTTYSYDAKGRLTQVAHSGSVNSGLTSTYAFDAADNRTNASVTGAPSDNQARLVFAVPLGGLLVISLPSTPPQ